MTDPSPSERARAIDPQRVQRALVCMHFDPAFAAAVRGDAALELPQPLSPAERALLRGVDPRTLRTDAMRRARAVQALLEEFPVTAALLGAPAVDAFFSTPRFREAVFTRGSMALAFAAHLELHAQVVGGAATIEAAAATVRRAAQLPPPAVDLVDARAPLRCAPRFAPRIVPGGTLAWYERALARLGPDPLRALAELRRPWRKRPPRGGQQFLLIEGKEGGSLALGGASEGLVRLLLAAAEPRPRAELAAVAVALGAEGHEAEELLDELVGDGLLLRVAAP
ncbi:MAG: hypothetical protein R3A79_11200 [Nannocystaceae bacterium]